MDPPSPASTHSVQDLTNMPVSLAGNSRNHWGSPLKIFFCLPGSQFDSKLVQERASRWQANLYKHQFQLFTVGSMTYSMSQLEAHQAARCLFTRLESLDSGSGLKHLCPSPPPAYGRPLNLFKCTDKGTDTKKNQDMEFGTKFTRIEFLVTSFN